MQCPEWPYFQIFCPCFLSTCTLYFRPQFQIWGLENMSNKAMIQSNFLPALYYKACSKPARSGNYGSTSNFQKSEPGSIKVPERGSVPRMSKDMAVWPLPLFTGPLCSSLSILNRMRERGILPGSVDGMRVTSVDCIPDWKQSEARGWREQVCN